MLINNPSKNEFEKLIAQGITLADFWAPWCGPCRMQSPVVEQLANELSQVNVVKINTDECLDLANDYSIDVIPTLIIFKDAKIIHTLVGFNTREKLLALLK